MPGEGIEHGEKRGVTGHAEVYGHGLAADVHGVLAVFLPIGGELFVNDGVTGGCRKFEDEIEPQARAGQKCSDGIAENSPHSLLRILQ